MIPTTALSVVQLEAYKKLVLVSLISGSTCPGYDEFPGLAQNLSTNLSILAAPYNALRDMAVSGSIDVKVVGAHSEVYLAVSVAPP